MTWAAKWVELPPDPWWDGAWPISRRLWTWSCRVRYLSWRNSNLTIPRLDIHPFDTHNLTPKKPLFTTMAPKKNARETAQAASATQSTPSSAPSTPAKAAAGKAAPANWDVVIQNIYNHYVKETTQRTKLIDAFLFFLVVVAALQFVYCVLVGNYVCCIWMMLCQVANHCLAVQCLPFGFLCHTRSIRSNR